MSLPRSLLLFASLALSSGAVAADLTWSTSGGSGTWDTVSTNWLDGSTASAFTDGDNVTFGEIGSSAWRTVTISGTVSPGSVTVNTNAGVYELVGSGSIAGSGAMTVAGSGRVDVGTANTHTGGTFLTGSGIVAVRGTNSGAFGTGAITARTGSSTSLYGASVSLANNLVVESGAALTLNFARNVNGSGKGDTTYSGDITGAGALTVTATGSDGGTSGNLTGSLAAFTGSLTLDSQSGNINLSSTNSATGASGAAFTVNGTNGSYATNVGSSGATFSMGSLSGAGRLRVAGGTLSVGVLNTDTTFSGILHEGSSVSLAKVGTGTLTLSDAATYTGATTIYDGTLEIGGAGRLGNSGIYAGAVVNAGTLRVNTTADQTFSGVISGAGALVKDNTGTLTLSGVNTYTGATTVNAGTLRITDSGSLTSSAVMVSGGVLRLDTAGKTLSALTLGSGSTLAAPLVSGSASLNVTGDLVLNGSPNFTVDASVADTSQLAGTYTLIGAGSVVGPLGTVTTRINGADLADTRLSGTVSVAGSGLVLSVSGSVQTATWAGGASGTWDVGTTSAWSTTDGRFMNLDRAVFGNPAADATITIAGTVTPTSVTIDNTAHYTFAGGGISGTGGITKEGAGTATFTNQNTFTGAVAINGGTLEIGGSGRFGADGVYAGTIANGGTLSVATTADQTLSGVISGTGALTKSGTGTLSLRAENTYTGGTVVDGGTLVLADPTNNGAGSIRGTLTVNNGGTVRLETNNSLGWQNGQKVDVINLNGGTLTTATSGDNGWGVTVNMTGGTLAAAQSDYSYTMGGGSAVNTFASADTAVISARLQLREGNANNILAFNVADGAAAVDLDVSGVISQNLGTFGIRKSGDGTMRLTALNTYRGGTTLTGGTLIAGHAWALGGGAVNVAGGALSTTVANLNVDNTFTLGTGGTLALNGTGLGRITLTANQNLSITGGEWMIDLASGVDQILGSGTGVFSITGGTLNLGGAMTADMYGANTYDLISGFSSGSVSGLVIAGYDTTNWSATLGNDGVLSFTAVPEPSAYGLLGAGALAAAAFVRRRRRTKEA